jgi:hypothetical protein
VLSLERVDMAWAAGAGLLCAALYATSLTGHPGLGDAPESIAGISSLGILHAPGYPAYVVAAKLFTLIVPFGSEAFRVNLFSLVCASLCVAGVQLLGRRLGAARWAAAIGALALGASSGFVFYSGFAKHDMFSGLVYLATLHLALAYAKAPTVKRMSALVAVIAVGLASSWPLELLVIPAVAYVLVRLARTLSLRAIVTASATGLVVLVAMYGFVMVRAAENPPLNWGDATTVGGLAKLVQRSDFARPSLTASPGFGGAGSAGAAPTGTVGSPNAPSPGAALIPQGSGAVTLASATPLDSDRGYALIFADQLGIAAIVLAAGGLLVSFFRRKPWAWFLLIAFLSNFVGAAAVVGGGGTHSLAFALIEEGFLLGCYFSLAAWTALGAGELVAAVTRIVGRRFALEGRHQRAFGTAGAVMIAALVIAPVAAGSRAVVSREAQPFADRYARSVFAELPRHAVVFSFDAELTQPLVYEQVVLHKRPDVLVVAADGLAYPWYRDEISRRLGRALPPIQGNSAIDATSAVKAVLGTRPVYLDPVAVEALTGLVGYHWVGLLAQAVRGTAAVPSSPAAFYANLRLSERTAGLPAPSWDLWPNILVTDSSYATAGLAVAGSFYHAGNKAGMRLALDNVLSIEPGNVVGTRDLALLQSQTGRG